MTQKEGGTEDVEIFIQKCIQELKITTENPVHCLVLTNQTVAKYSGFESIYESFKKSGVYSGVNYSQLNTELLSRDVTSLGIVPKLIFNIIDFKFKLKDKHTPVTELISDNNILNEMNISDLRKLIKALKLIKGETLGEFILSISDSYKTNQHVKLKETIRSTLGLENVSYKVIYNFLLESLYPNLHEEKVEEANENIQDILNISMEEYETWHQYILRNSDSPIQFHTYHGTKGLEFNNVIIIMGNKFGRVGNYFNFFFENYTNISTLSNEDAVKFEEVKNLLYVSCSRAIKNLRILYIDDTTSFKEAVQDVFGQILDA